MPRHKPAVSPSSRLRQTIASAAARLMAEDGIADYGLAKRKAAKMLGAGESEILPGNEEVAAELRVYQGLFQEEAHEIHLRVLRQVALSAMRFFAGFRPYLTGAVLDGTAGRYAEIEIELFTDSAKDVEIFLLSHNISYEIAANHQKGQNSPETRLRLEWEGSVILLAVYPLQAERWQKTGQRSTRAQANAVAALLVE